MMCDLRIALSARRFLLILFILSVISAGSMRAQGEPQPKPAAQAILTAFDKYRIVAMPAAHGDQKLDDFIVSILRDPALLAKINDLVVECGNSLYQDRLDRYIAGEDVPLSDIRQVWRNTTQTMCGLSGFYEKLFPLVRDLNRQLPHGKKLRVLAADPPIDWSKARTLGDVLQFTGRDRSIASVVEREVLEKGHKALMLFGVFHLFHHAAQGALPELTAVGQYERRYPGVTLVVSSHQGFGNMTPNTGRNAELERRMATWPLPSLIEVKGTWLAELASDYFFAALPMGTNSSPSRKGIGEMVDAYLYLGPRDSLTYEPTPETILTDAVYIKELQRRSDLQGGTGAVNVEQLRTRNKNSRLYDPNQRLPVPRALPGAGNAVASAPRPVQPSIPPANVPTVRLSATELNRLVGIYEPDSGGATPILQIELVNDKLVARLPPPGGKVLLPLSATRFQPEGMSADSFLEFELASGKVKRVTFAAGPSFPKTVFLPKIP
jgi:hypothetical protein